MGKDEIMVALRDKMPIEQMFHDLGIKVEPKSEDKMVVLKNILAELEGSGNAEILDDALNILKEVKVENLYDELKRINNHPYAVVFDGVVSQRLLDIAHEKGIKHIVAIRSGEIVKRA